MIHPVVEVRIIILLILSINFFTPGAELHGTFWSHHLADHLRLFPVVKHTTRGIERRKDDRASRNVFKLGVLSAQHLLGKRVCR